MIVLLNRIRKIKISTVVWTSSSGVLRMNSTLARPRMNKTVTREMPISLAEMLVGSGV